MTLNYYREVLMKLYRLIAGLLLITSCTVCTRGDGKKYVYPYTSVLSSDANAKLGELNFSIFSSMSAGNFFKSLEYRMVGSGGRFADEFHKDGRVVSLFPEELEVVVGFHTVAGHRNK